MAKDFMKWVIHAGIGVGIVAAIGLLLKFVFKTTFDFSILPIAIVSLLGSWFAFKLVSGMISQFSFGKLDFRSMIFLSMAIMAILTGAFFYAPFATGLMREAIHVGMSMFSLP